MELVSEQGLLGCRIKALDCFDVQHDNRKIFHLLNKLIRLEELLVTFQCLKSTQPAAKCW